MNYKSLDLKRSYRSCGDNQIGANFLTPILSETKIYRRSVGYFSSGVFQTILDGIVSLARNHGHIQLIASPQLQQEDVDAINTGYKMREEVVFEAFSNEFCKEIDHFDDPNLQLLVDLISSGVLDIKIAITTLLGEYHDKLGILEDLDGNMIAFFGSSNSSLNGYQNNYEKIRLARSWVQGESEVVTDELEEFNALWNNKNQFVTVYDYTESARQNLLQIIRHRKSESISSGRPIKLRDYQEEAIQKWVDNNYHGFYVMATGTGKTWTAIYSAMKLLENHKPHIVICAPYKHLVKQWAEDVNKAFPESIIILVSSENPDWSVQISDAFVKKKYNPNVQIIIISTIASFKMKRFTTVMNKSNAERLLIVDEAHRFTDRTEELKLNYQYMLGLSATPFSGSSAAAGLELMNFFGGKVFSLTIEEALAKGYLVKYYYHPIYVHATKDEEKQFQYYTKRILSCFNSHHVCINSELLAKTLRARLRVISMSEEKQSRLDMILNTIDEKDHLVVYCGDGRLFDSDYGEELRHIQSVKRKLSTHGHRASQFTAKETMPERMELVRTFNEGEITALAAIRCLDEGINIPSIKSALILSSNDDYREFVQRRGRILRTYPGKDNAVIHDIIVLPSTDLCGWAKIELRRFREYARLAINWNKLEGELENLLSNYGISEQEIDVYDYENKEDILDE